MKPLITDGLSLGGGSLAPVAAIPELVAGLPHDRAAKPLKPIAGGFRSSRIELREAICAAIRDQSTQVRHATPDNVVGTACLELLALARVVLQCLDLRHV
jgi:hypothetical protein